MAAEEPELLNVGEKHPVSMVSVMGIVILGTAVVHHACLGTHNCPELFCLLLQLIESSYVNNTRSERLLFATPLRLPLMAQWIGRIRQQRCTLMICNGLATRASSVSGPVVKRVIQVSSFNDENRFPKENRFEPPNKY